MNCLPPMLYFGLHWSEQLRVAPAIVLTNEQERELTRLARSKRTSVRLATLVQAIKSTNQTAPRTSNSDIRALPIIQPCSGATVMRRSALCLGY